MRKDRAIPRELKTLADCIGDFIEYWGFKRVHGRIWTHLMVSRSPLDASDLMKRLRISKALVSMSLSDLLYYRVIQEVGKSRRGTLLYQASPNVIEVIVNVLQKRERKMLSQLVTGHRNLKKVGSKHIELNPENLKLLGTFIEVASEGLECFIARLQFDLSALGELNLVSPTE